ncbi:leucyl/phenylalanyl-tRNA--protein transferase [Pontitalea aquivivens]|uniref:leucyl/phenylalanyl-tRNA--protein transferase n=1 Tax=Pontitalea aquivivens TaxID=3388663 RepID=UPI003970C7B6
MGHGLTGKMLLAGYARGIFPMAESRDDPTLYWVDPRQRGVIPLDGFHLSRSLARTIRRSSFRISTDAAFAAVVDGCAARAETWINAPLRALYNDLHAKGVAHSLEVWAGDQLIGGVFGIALGGAFFGESMFSLRRDASKIALTCLVDRLRQAGFSLLDTQFLTPHLASLGGVEIPRAEYRRQLARALRQDADFTAPPPAPDTQSILQRMIQTS